MDAVGDSLGRCRRVKSIKLANEDGRCDVRFEATWSSRQVCVVLIIRWRRGGLGSGGCVINTQQGFSLSLWGRLPRKFLRHLGPSLQFPFWLCAWVRWGVSVKRLGFLSFILFCSKKDFFSPEKKPGDTFIAVVKKKTWWWWLVGHHFLFDHPFFFLFFPPLFSFYIWSRPKTSFSSSSIFVLLTFSVRSTLKSTLYCRPHPQ